MKKTSAYLLISLSILLFACNNTQKEQVKSEEPVEKQQLTNDYSGVYKSDAGKGCNLTIKLVKENSGYKYFLTGEHYDAEGIAIIEQSDAVYITFDGPIGNNKPKTVSGQIDGNSIKIQNYGNSMNEYHYFVECDQKYLEFKK